MIVQEQGGSIINIASVHGLVAAREFAHGGPGLRRVEPAQAHLQLPEVDQRHGLAVPGGRIGPVGVPGLLLAGGVNFYGNEVGWAADSVVNYEIVLADGSLTNVNKTHLPDLFWALKGGSSNFGIVTRFDVETIKSPKIWGGTYTVEAKYLDQFLEVCLFFPHFQLIW